MKEAVCSTSGKGKLENPCNAINETVDCSREKLRKLILKEVDRRRNPDGEISIDQLHSLRVLFQCHYDRDEVELILSDVVVEEFNLQVTDMRTKLLAVP